MVKVNSLKDRLSKRLGINSVSLSLSKCRNTESIFNDLQPRT